VFERYTERARQVIVLAQDEARNLGHPLIGTEHVLLGLIREEEGIASRVLHQLSVSIDDLRDEVRLTVGSGDMPAGQIPFTPRAKKVLELALREALSLGHNYIGTEHILLGLVREGEGLAIRMLESRGLSAEVIRNEIVRALSPLKPGGALSPTKNTTIGYELVKPAKSANPAAEELCCAAEHMARYIDVAGEPVDRKYVAHLLRVLAGVARAA